ncbi:MAG: glucokinase [Nitrospiraceae bacterium]|nr:glucokinase [Nitrospiraceae bacterium]
MKPGKILAADIGGTNSRFGHFETEPDGSLRLVRSQWFRTGDASSFGRLMEILRESAFSLLPQDADVAVMAVAGPVEQGAYSAPPLIPWDVDVSDMQTRHGCGRTVLINDFIAQAYACRSPVGKAAREILAGSVYPGAAAAVIGAGTGLGKAALIADRNGSFIAVPSEGGHAAFPFVSGPEFRFMDFLRQEHGMEYATGNDIVSGKGLGLIHQFLSGEKLDPRDIAARFTSGSETLVWAARFYGRVCRDFALEVFARGGLYIAGGIAAKAPELVTNEAFASEFRDSKTMGRILAQMPVFLITNEESGLWGAARYGQQLLKKGG